VILPENTFRTSSADILGTGMRTEMSEDHTTRAHSTSVQMIMLAVCPANTHNDNKHSFCASYRTIH